MFSIEYFNILTIYVYLLCCIYSKPFALDSHGLFWHDATYRMNFHLRDVILHMGLYCDTHLGPGCYPRVVLYTLPGVLMLSVACVVSLLVLIPPNGSCSE